MERDFERIEKDRRNNDNISFSVVSAIIASYGLSILTLILAATWVLSAPDPELLTISARSEVVRNFGLVGAAMLGLAFAIWRSVLASQQTREALAQGRRTELQLLQTSRQVASSEENNLALLVEKGARLVNEAADAEKAAGLALLKYVATTPRTPFLAESRDLILNYLNRTRVTPDTHIPKTAIHYLRDIHTAEGYRGRYIVDFIYADNQYKTPTFPHLMFTTYENCRFINDVFDDDYPTFRDCSFSNCTFLEGIVVEGLTYFTKCRVPDIFGTESASFINLDQCDVSGMAYLPGEATVTGCYYRADNRPSKEILERYTGIKPLPNGD